MAFPGSKSTALLVVALAVCTAGVWLWTQAGPDPTRAGDGASAPAEPVTHQTAAADARASRSATPDDATAPATHASQGAYDGGPDLAVVGHDGSGEAEFDADDERESLDDAPARVVAQRLEEAIDRARRERGVPISPGLVDRVIDEGAVPVIVTQPPSQPLLEPRLAGDRHEPAHYFAHIPFAAIELGPQALLEIVESRDVFGIEEDRKHAPSLAATVPLISADAATAAGYDGSGMVVAILDTGVDTAHPAFAGRVIDEACFSRDGDCPGGGTQEFGVGTGVPCTFSCGHGTLVAGVALGLDPGAVRTGVAPDAGLVSVMVYSDDNGLPAAYTSDIIAGLEHVYDLRLFYNIGAANLSLGGDPYNSTAACDAANVARKAAIDLLRGISVPTVVSSGNEGFTDLITEPGCISTAVSVGATSKADEVSGFSNSATFLSLLAPGELVETTNVGGGFGLSSGTSIAAPHVAGAWAAILEAVPGSNVAEVLFALQSTGQPIVDARNAITTPRIDVAAAITALDAGIDIDDPVGGTGGNPQAVPPPASPSSACGLVGLEVFLVWSVVGAARRLRGLGLHAAR